MPLAITLSEAAESLLEIHFSGRSLHLKGPKPESLPGLTLEETLSAYRELAVAGLMYPVSGFAHGAEAYYRLTEAGWGRKENGLGLPVRPPGSPATVPSPQG